MEVTVCDLYPMGRTHLVTNFDPIGLALARPSASDIRQKMKKCY
jgi:hypothetical protein